MKFFTTCTASWKVLRQSKDSRYKLTGFNLQLFNGEKTEEATPKRRQESRKKDRWPKAMKLIRYLLFWQPSAHLSF